MNIKLEAVAQFSFSLATCLASGLPPGKALELSGASSNSSELQRAARSTAAEVAQGIAISDGLESSCGAFPHFVVPVIRAGETSGRLVEALRLIQAHCERLRPTQKLLRDVWLIPLICLLFGWCVRIGLLLYFGMPQAAWLILRDTILGSLAVVLMTWTALQVRLVKEWIDLCLLQLPLVRETIIRLSLALFFATFRLGYEAGGLGVLRVFDLALRTIGNSAVRKDLLRARPILEDGGTFEEAFAEPRLLDDLTRSSIATGALAGHLGPSLDQVVRRQALELESSLTKFNRLAQMLIAYGVAMSIVGTLVFCLLSAPGR